MKTAPRISWRKPAADFGPSAAFLGVARMLIQRHPSKPCGWAKLSGHFLQPRGYAGQRNARRGATRAGYRAMEVRGTWAGSRVVVSALK